MLVVDHIARIKLDPSNSKLTEEQRTTLKANIQLLRDAMILFTATGAARGVSGHTGEHIVACYDTDVLI